MVSKKSIMKSVQKENIWISLHPNISTKELIKHRILNTPKFVREAFEIDVRLSTLPSILVPMPKSAVNKLQQIINKRKRLNNRAESPIAIIATIMISLILMIGVMFAMGNFVDGFLFIMNKLPVEISDPILQHSMTKLMYLATIFFAIPAIFGATLIVWGMKAIIRRHGYTRQGNEYFIEEF